jgi:hypothetical protein
MRGVGGSRRCAGLFPGPNRGGVIRISFGGLVFLVRAPRDDAEASSGNRRCSSLASSHAARIQTSRSSVIRMTGMAFGWIGSTKALGDVVRKP